MLSAKYSKKCEGCLVTQVMFANKIECIGGGPGLHLGQNFDINRKIFLVPGEIFIDISHHILAVANLISKIFNLAISYTGIKIYLIIGTFYVIPLFEMSIGRNLAALP